MGKKLKTGKARKDKFYHLAKETGYRSRASFKLLQLNRKFEFLQKSRVCVDLCAAPGGWLQVAANQMPISSIIVGVDLVPIKALPGCSTFQEDITTDKCRQTIKRELRDWKADVFLNDGAPNIGSNWIYDAYQQAELTLAAMKLATDFLKKGGWFVTKVFRSKDYHALMWVFKQLFAKVHATKPQASRNESAEIFVVCQGYHAPDKLDPKFTNPKFVFKDVENTSKAKLNLVHPEKISKKADGYVEGDYMLYYKLEASKFIAADNHLELLAQCSQIVIDNKHIQNHPKTTKEIKECVKDIKVLGKKEIRMLISWQRVLKKYMQNLKEEVNEVEMKSEEEEDLGDEEEKELAEQLSQLKEEEQKTLKKKKKKVLKEKRKLRDKMSLNMVLPGDCIEQNDEQGIFNLKQINSKAKLTRVEAQSIEAAAAESDDEDLDQFVDKRHKHMMTYSRHEEPVGPESSDDELEFEDDDGPNNSEEEDDEETMNPLVVEMESKDMKSTKNMELWFEKAAFVDVEDEKDEDLEIDDMVKDYTARGGQVTAQAEKMATATKKKMQVADCSENSDSDDSGSSDDSDSSDSDNDDIWPTATKKVKDHNQKKDGFEVVPIGPVGGRVRKLDPIGLAIGEELVKSRKRRREIEELSFHRFTFNDDHLPDWFTKDEQKHLKKIRPVDPEQIEYYKQRQKSIDARPIKKVAEAKARKQRKSAKKLERARKKAESITDAVDTSDREKWSKIKDVYKRAGLLKKKQMKVTYVVAKKGSGKKVHRPTGVKGRFKVVDPRMKKDDMRRKQSARSQKKGPKSRGTLPR